MEVYIPSFSYSKHQLSPKWFDHSCSIACKQKSKAYNRYLSLKTQPSLNYYKHTRDHAKNVVKLAKNNFYHKKTDLLLNNPNNNKIFWSTLNAFNSNFNKVSSTPPLSSANGSIVSDPVGKANLLVNQFANNSTLPDMDMPFPEVPVQYPDISSLRITNKKVKSILDKLDLNKSCGPDQIPAVVLKRCSPELTPVFSKLFRLINSKSTFPQSWKLANIHPISKKGDLTDPSNYRPIALTSIISKVFETIINDHIVSHLDQYSILQDTQYGFRKRRSTIDHLISISHKFCQSIEQYGESYALALDISKAFDRVWHAGLLSKLPSLGLSVLSPLIESFLSNRSIRVLVDNCISDIHTINAGVPQGSVLGPTLFLLNINDMLTQTSNPIHSYADDSTLYSSFGFRHCPSQHQLAESRLNTYLAVQEDIESVTNWGTRNQVSFNPSKTQFIVFSNRKTTASNINFQDTTIFASPSLTLLGVNIDRKLLWTNHVTSVYKNASRKMGLLYKTKHYFNSNQLLTIYNSHIRSQMEYCSPLWGGCCQTALNRLNRLQNRAIQLIDNSVVTDGMPSLAVRRSVSTLSLLYRYFHHDCSDELHSMMPAMLARPRNTRGLYNAHPYSLSQKVYRSNALKNSFLPRSVKLWNSLPSSCFPSNYNLPLFKRRCFSFFLSGQDHPDV